MIQFALIVAGLFAGLIINSLADDLPQRVRPLAPHCHHCGFPYHRSQWVGLFALVVRRWRCAQCDAPMQWRRVVVEIASAAMLVYLFERFGLTVKFGLLSLLLECLLLITVIDLEHRLILYVTVFPAALIAALYSLFGAERELSKVLVGGAVGFAVVYAIYLFGWAFGAIAGRLRGQPLAEIPFGGGDVNLAGVIGLAVGWSGIVVALFIAVVCGGIGASLYLLIAFLRRRYNLFTAIPYGPFLVIGAVALLLFDSEIKNWLAR